MKKRNKFISGIGHALNPVPQNRKEVLQHGNALTASGNYPVGTDACFNIGISGGCGPDCFVYLEGKCHKPQEMISRLDAGEIKAHNKLYPPIERSEKDDEKL